MFEFDSEFFNLNQIADSGQCFRWQEIFCDNESKKYHYQVPVKDKLLNIFQDDKKIKIDCTESEFESFWKNYFDFNTDYKKIASLIVDDEYLQRAIKYGYGITHGQWLPKNKELFEKFGIEVNFDNLGINYQLYEREECWLI